MSLSSTTNRNDYTGNGSVSTYSYTFPIVANSDLLVVVADTASPPNLSTLTIGTDYTVSGAGVAAGGSITLVSAGQSWLTTGNLTLNYKLILLRIRPLTQTTDVRNQGVYYPGIIEDEFDGLVMIDQQQQEQLNRAVTLPKNLLSSAFNPVLPTEITTPGATIQVNPAGNGFQVVPPVAGGVGIFGTPAQEVPSGALNGINVTFTTSNVPISNASLSLFLDGLIQIQGTDYTISSSTITMTSAPLSGEKLYAVYQH